MAAVNPPVNAVAYITYIALEDMANPGSYKANPTLASGDAKVSIDGGAFNDLATLPAVTPAAGRAVKVSLSAGEMTGDNIFVQMVDQTNPKEWADYAFTIQTVAAAWNVGKTGYSLSTAGVQAIWDALTSALTTVGSIGKRLADDIDATISSRSTYAGGAVASVTGNVGGNVVGSVGSVTADVGITQTGADKVWSSAARTLTSFGTLVADTATAVWGAATRILTAGTNIVLAKGVGVTGFNDLSSAQVQTAADAALTAYGAATIANQTTINDNVLAVPTANENADALLTRDLTAVATPASRSLFNAIRKLMNRVGISAGTLTVYQEDDATPAYTQTVTQDAAQTPIKELDTN